MTVLGRGSATLAAVLLASHGALAARIRQYDALGEPNLYYSTKQTHVEKNRQIRGVAGLFKKPGQARGDDDIPVQEAKEELLDVNMICGGPQIWNLLSVSSSVTSVQNIKWSKMEAVKVDYVREQEIKVQGLEVELESLAAIIAQKEEEQQAKYTSPEETKQLVEAALGSESFGGLDIAQRSGCGSVRGGSIKAPRHAFRKSEGLFSSAAEKFFEGGKYRLDSDAFRQTCNELLPQENEGSYCAQLCQRFKDTAQKLSDSSVGETTGNLDTYLQQQAAKTEALAKAREEIAECSKAWEGISLLRANLMELKGAMNDRFRSFQDAEFALDDASWEMTDLDENLKEEEESLKAALEAYGAAGVASGKASTLLQEVMGKEKSVRQRLEDMQGPMQRGRAQFEAAKNADKTVVDLKSAVSATMVKMDLFFRSAVAQPLAELGFSPDLNVDGPEVFAPEPVSTHAGGLLKKSVDDLREYCSDTAMPAFAAVKDEVDLEPLCAVGETSNVMEGLNKAVLTRSDHIKKNLLWVKSWLNPYRDNKKMTKENAAELVVQGEPKGFQEIISVYHSTEFFKYLKDWRLGGPHLELLAKLKKVSEMLDGAVHDMEAAMEGLKTDLTDLVAAREKAIKELDEATAQENLAKEQKDVLERSVLGMRENAARLANQLDELEEAVRKAKEAYDAAALKLVEAHQQGVTAMPHSKESMAELEAKSKEAELLVSLIERSLARTEQSYGESQAQLTKLQK